MTQLSVGFTSDGAPVAMDELKPATFKSGAPGWRGNIKMGVDGKRYQVNINVVEIGHGKKPEVAKKTRAPRKTKEATI